MVYEQRCITEDGGHDSVYVCSWCQSRFPDWEDAYHHEAACGD